ncbi:hypothetical protein [Prauserella marina]|nr:hypothetical protein [Prauserella marina]
MRKPMLAVCALLALTACGAPAADDDQAGGTAGAATAGSSSTAPMTAAPVSIAFGSDHRFPSGLVVSVAEPKLFRPSDSAYPRSERAAAFGIAIYNETEQPYRLSSLSVRATVSEKDAQQVVDATQGYTGIVDADRDLPPGAMARVTLAFAMPSESCPVVLTIRPETATGTTAVYSGSV